MAKAKKECFDHLEDLVMGRMALLQSENAQLRNELTIARAKLSVYERLASITDSKTSLGFGPPTDLEGRD